MPRAADVPSHLATALAGALSTLLTITSLTGCGEPEAESDTDTSTGTDTGTDTDTEAGVFADDLSECGAPITCSTLSYQSYAPPNMTSYPSDAEYECAFAALRDRTPTLLVVSDDCEGMCAGSVYLIRPDGTALRQYWTEAFEGGVDLGGSMVDFSPWDGNGVLCSLKEPSFYDTCDRSPDGDCDYDDEWFVDCGPATEQNCGLDL